MKTIEALIKNGKVDHLRGFQTIEDELRINELLKHSKYNNLTAGNQTFQI